MRRQLTALMEKPSKETYLAMRAAALRGAALPITAGDFVDLEQRLEAAARSEEAATDVLDRIDALPASKVLSPRVHLLAAEAADVLRDVERSELERFLFAVTLRGLLATGDGTAAAPYIVCHATDARDIAKALGLDPAGQSLVERDGRMFDLLVCTNGRELWFDVSGVVNRPQTRKITAKAAGLRGPKSRTLAGVSRRVP
jgi:hypothetical protein